jgi:hypothetical protein
LGKPIAVADSYSWLSAAVASCANCKQETLHRKRFPAHRFKVSSCAQETSSHRSCQDPAAQVKFHRQKNLNRKHSSGWALQPAERKLKLLIASCAITDQISFAARTVRRFGSLEMPSAGQEIYLQFKPLPKRGRGSAIATCFWWK